MRVLELLTDLRTIWVDRVSHLMARGEIVRESFVDQLNQFYDLLQQAIVTGDPAWLNSILDQWADARTQSEVERRRASISPMLNQILMATYECAQEELSPDDGLILLGAVLPVYMYAFDYTTQRETRLHIDHISRQLDRARVTLENLDKSKSDFIAVAAHELKTPLTLIEGYASMLRDKFPVNDQESPGVLFLKGIDNGISRLREIINDMIDVSLIDNNMLKLNFQPVWINQLLKIVKREMAPTISERSQEFLIIAFDGSNEMTYGDPERLYQALRNVLANAIKYTPDGGKITVDGRKLPGFIEITIADTGIGIDEAYHEQIFEKFGRLGNASLHSSSKTKFKGGGPGLGLPITRGLIEAHGGSIWVESDGYDEVKCPGSIFHILLPIHKESPDAKLAKLFKPLSDINKENDITAGGSHQSEADMMDASLKSDHSPQSP
jgi:signal transduction histidine kinase